MSAFDLISRAFVGLKLRHWRLVLPIKRPSDSSATPSRHWPRVPMSLTLLNHIKIIFSTPRITSYRNKIKLLASLFPFYVEETAVWGRNKPTVLTATRLKAD